MKQKTSKLRKLEQNRYSILTNDLNMCYMCHFKGQIDIHEICGGSNRIASIKNGFCIPLCRRCHTMITNDEALSKVYKKICQKKFEETHTREEWIAIIGRNYLD